MTGASEPRMGRLFGYSREELIACVEREINMRERVYPIRIATHRMGADFAAEQIALMRAVLEFLKAKG